MWSIARCYMNNKGRNYIFVAVKIIIINVGEMNEKRSIFTDQNDVELLKLDPCNQKRFFL